MSVLCSCLRKEEDHKKWRIGWKQKQSNKYVGMGKVETWKEVNRQKINKSRKFLW